MAASPLDGWRIAVTRPRTQAAGLLEGITRLGGHALSFPLLEIEPAPDPVTLNAQLERLTEFDLLIFISPNAVQYGLAALATATGSTQLPPTVHVAAVGQGSAQALRAAGIFTVIAPTERYDSEALLALPSLQSVAGQRVLILRGDGGRELLGDTLKQRGAHVTYATCYRRGKPTFSAAEWHAAHPQLITVSSSEALRHLWALFSVPERQKLAACPLFVPHERIAAAARDLGWQEVIQTPSGDDGMLSGLVAWAARHTSDRP